MGGLRLGNRSNAHLHALGPYRQLRRLSRWRIKWKPLDPLLVEPGKICFLGEDDRRAHDLFERASCRRENCRDVAQALSGLFLDGFAVDFTGNRIKRALACDKYQSSGLDRLTVGRRWHWGL